MNKEFLEAIESMNPEKQTLFISEKTFLAL